MPFHQVTYISTSDARLSAEDIAALAADADARNRRLEISGVLLFNGTNFLQILEGDEAAVGALLERIGRDTRHSGLIVMARSMVPARTFLDLGMRLWTAAPPEGLMPPLPARLVEICDRFWTLSRARPPRSPS